MKLCILLAVFFSLARCSNELTFENRFFEKKTSLPCKGKCPQITVKIPFAKNVPIIADSINRKVFLTIKEIVYPDKKPTSYLSYNTLLASFITSYEKLQRDFPKDAFGWEGQIEGSVTYLSNEILNIKIKHYTYTGGAHGYQGIRSLLFDPNTGKTIPNKKIFNDNEAFKAFAEKQFRTKYKIPANDPINSTGLEFEDEHFVLPQNIFFTDKGLLLYYNRYEVASYADGTKELLLPYGEIENYLALR